VHSQHVYLLLGISVGCFQIFTSLGRVFILSHKHVRESCTCEMANGSGIY